MFIQKAQTQFVSVVMGAKGVANLGTLKYLYDSGSK